MDKKLQAAVNIGKNNDSEISEKRTGKKLISPNQKMEAVFLFFLEHGRLPWYGREEDIREISRDKKWNECLLNTQFSEQLTRLLAEEEFPAQRFALQFSESMIFNFLKINNQKLNDADIEKLRQLTKQNTAENQKLFLQWLVEFVVRENKLVKKIHLQKLKQIFPGDKILSAEEIKMLQIGIVPILKKIHPEFLEDEDWSTIFELRNDNKSVRGKTKRTSDNPIYSEERFQLEENELFLNNAGLILLHPFFKSFFEELEFLDETGQILNSRKELAVQALHFLATGNEDFFEGNLLFEKFLCNVPQKWPIPRESLLNDPIKNEAESLLNAAIKNWPALKSTSPDGLRQNFLQREGKLIQNEKNTRLLVERKTQDILLERISWNISVVKLPWKENLIHVEW